MNELQQVLLIFAVVVIAGLYFLSRSRQNDIKKKNNSKQKDTKANQASQTNAASDSTQEIEHSIDDATLVHKRKASEALNELGTAHIPVSETTEKRFTHSDETQTAQVNSTGANSNAAKSISETQATDLTSQGVNQSANQNNNASSAEHLEAVADDIHPNQGKLFFGDEFEANTTNSLEADSAELGATEQINDAQEVTQAADSTTVDMQAPVQNTTDGAKEAADVNKRNHHVLVVDDPGMTGELNEDQFAPDYVKPSFGIPNAAKQEVTLQSPQNQFAAKKDPEVFVLMVMTAAEEFEMTKVNQALYGVGLTLSEQSIFVKKDNMGNDFIKVANLLEPGTFPSENLESYSTPGVAMILELPTSVRAPAAMHELIMMARKVSQRLNARLYNMERHLIKESDLQSMRDAALDYESEPLAQ